MSTSRPEELDAPATSGFREAQKRIADAKRSGVSIFHIQDLGLTSVPPEIGQLTHLTELYLGNNQLTSVPPEINKLTQLTKLSLSSNRLTRVPPEIGQLTQLTSLSLNSNKLTSLPPEIGQLTQLSSLILCINQLTNVPREIGQLIQLKELVLFGNCLTHVPPEIGQLAQLTALELDQNQLTNLPPEIGQLTQLISLTLFDNQLTSIPSEMGRLTQLGALRIDQNQLTSIPPEIGQLTRLTQLNLGWNKLTSIPPEIGRLSELTHLFLHFNNLTTIPQETEQLTQLTEIYLGENQLTSVPSNIGRFAHLRRLDLDHNPLNDALQAAYFQGITECLGYLRSLADSVRLYEAKLLLVGEGNVGKSCILAALCGEKFEKRPTTHGIEIKDVKVTTTEDQSTRIPSSTVITLHGWDFGGQNVYRVTHQFFYSRRSLYLIVWNARDTAEKCDVVGWLERIRLRVGDEARVLVVCTQVDTVDRLPRIDDVGLRARFGTMIPSDGFIEVDSESGRGIDRLRELIAREACLLPQMGEPFGRKWKEARDAVLKVKQAQIKYDTFRDKCREQQLSDIDTKTLAVMLHDQGHIVYFDDDQTLRDMVILKPEWLSKAIGYILEDKLTNEAGGILDHRRLLGIWHDDRKATEKYDPRFHPYFLRLMERFDVSYQINEQSSLLGELVPNNTPVLPWNRDSDVIDGQTELTQMIQFHEAPPGLMPWLIVRHHRRRYIDNANSVSSGIHWRRGLLLADAQHGEGLIELIDRELCVTVRGSYPSHLLSVLVDSVTTLVEDRWPGLKGKYHLSAPCPTKTDNGRCRGRFDVHALYNFKAVGEQRCPCLACKKWFPIDKLLIGYGPPLADQFERVHERFDEAVAQRQQIARASTTEREVIAGKLAEFLRLYLKSQETESRDGPRLFSLINDNWDNWLLYALDPRFWGKAPYRLTLWCEMPDDEHPLCAIGASKNESDSKLGEYVFTRPKDWLKKISPLVRFTAQTLKLVAPIVGSAAKLAIPAAHLQGVSPQLDIMEKIASVLNDGLADSRDRANILAESPFSGPFRQRGEAAGIRELHLLLKELDKSQTYGGLSRVLDKTSGDYLWVCKHHRELYFDPPLPNEADLRPK
jgi:internalin A